MYRIVALFIGLIFTALPAVGADAEGKKYGAGTTLEKGVAITDLLAKPADFVGKQVRIDGVITEVCKKRGCWMMLTDPASGKGLRIKVDDGVIVFPIEAMGKKASAEGVFEELKLTPEQVAAHAKEEAAEQGKPVDEVAPKAEGETIYQLKGTGAVIY